MKIKQKKRLNLPQLIEWVEKNEVRNHVFISDIDRNEVEINIHGCIFCKYITLKDTFTVEVEEEITEDTVIPEMLTIYFNGDSRIQNNKRLNDLNTTYHIKSAYIMNDDLRLILIWRDGKLVE